ncbi:MAG: hypothetical protein ACRDLL_00650 [Solirubrobacterales bacterium]
MTSRHKTRIVVATVTLIGIYSLVLTGCGGGGSSTSAPAGSAPTTTSTYANAPAHRHASRPATSGPASADQFNPKDFGDPATGANKWLPLKPGTQWVRQGFVNVGTRRLPHQVVTTVTDVSKQVDGVRAVAVVDQDTNGGQIAEQSIDWLAEDKLGNVWYLGSYTESYTGGQFVNAYDAWLASVNGAQPGILMQANPKTGTPPYSEDTVPGIETATAQIAKTGQSQCVPFKCYKDALVVQEGGEYKYYAPGVGQIKTAPQTAGGKQEIEQLINLTQLSRSGLSKISALTLSLDKHAQAVAPDVFGHAPSAKRTL